MSKYCVMDPGDALRYLKSRDAGETPSLIEVVRTAGSGEFVSDEPVKALTSVLKKLKARFPDELRERDRRGGEFEQQACEVVHRCLSRYDRDVLANLDFWTWLAVAKFSDLIEWRFNSHGKHAKPENYGIGKRTENLLFRLWLRAEIGRDEQGAYTLAKTGDQDLWRSHILRPAYSNARYVAKAVLKLQAGLLKAKRLHPSDDDGVRVLAKRLSRLRANLMFEYLDMPRAEKLVSELSMDLKKAS